MDKPFYDIDKIASLAKLKLTDEEAKALPRQFEEAVRFASILTELPPPNTEEQKASVCPSTLREDSVSPSYERDILLSAATEREDEYFKVGQVIG